MSLAEIKETEDISKSSNGPRKTFWEEMARKTIVKRASKYWPQRERLDNAIHVLNDTEGVHQEPILPHTPESVIIDDENNRKQAFYDLVNLLCQKMELAQNINELKPLFTEAFQVTRGMKLQQNVQAIYKKCKAKFKVTKS